WASRSSPAAASAGERPLREEFLGLDALTAHARALAATLPLARPTRRGAQTFFARLDGAARTLREAYASLAADVQAGQPLTPAAEWLLDNFHLIEAQLVEVRRNLPPSYYRELPKLGFPEWQGFPRMYGLALELIRRSDARLDSPRLVRFLAAFQTAVPLSIGELWTWPLMLQAALLENLRRLATEVLARREAAARATGDFNRWTAAAVAGELPQHASMTYLVELLERLHESGPEASQLHAAVAGRLRLLGATPEEALRADHQNEAICQASIANSIGSLRLCATLNWSHYVERVGLVEQILQRDPAGVYGRMDFATRDRYRQAVEELAERNGPAQVAIALRTVERARQAAEAAAGEEREAHVGHYLIGAGRPALETGVDYRPPLRRRLRRLLRARPAFFYLGSIGLVTALLVAAAMRLAIAGRFDPWVALLLLLPLSELAIQLVQWLFVYLAPPRRLPRLDLAKGVPAEGRTMVVVPAILTSPTRARELVEQLEVHALGNLDPRIHFALLGDFADAPAETMPGDEDVLAAAREGIESLEARYGGGRFFLLQRARRWNPREGCWMGWERKRGKLEEFNSLLRGEKDTSYTALVGDLSVLSKIRYCITLDSDTRLPRDTAKQLLGVILHPLHRARFDSRRRRVIEGYGILQPRVSVTRASAAGSVFSRIHAGNTGVDPYTTAVSDTYQDLFGEGIYTGKGLYDVEAFSAALANRVPENALLSHDLFEGLFARAALVSDAEVVDDFPANVLAHTHRQHRWVRGDWQMISWLLRSARDQRGRRRNRLPLIGRWKILDNLRRSLVAPALLLLLAGAWTVLPGEPWAWMVAALAVLAFPLYRPLARSLRGPGSEQSPGLFLRELGQGLATAAAQTSLSIILLVHQATTMLHAIGVTLLRLFVTRRHLLEWTTAARVERLVSQYGLGGFCRAMIASPIFAAALLLVVVLTRPRALLLAAPFVLAWLAAPFIAYGASRPRRPEGVELGAEDRALLEEVARKTWHYFETFIGPEDHHLPPDNYQEAEPGGLAHRTSPTNIAMGLLATLAAHDLGYLDTSELVERIEATLTSIEGLERFQGHLLNWYDSRSLAPLQPRYVSTVDSGNLAASLIALAQGLRWLAEKPPASATLGELAERAAALEEAMDFRFLFDADRKLFSIGYRLADAEGPGRLDSGSYDLLASEARLASFLAIARGDVPQEHWFHLGRALVGAGGRPILVSWGASMFEYLMPLLLLESYPDTLLDESVRNAVRVQVGYGRTRRVPWGVSESAFNIVDRHGTYQYQAFGVPGLGLRRGLGDDLVISPYSTALAAMVDAERAARNMRRLRAEGLEGDYGFYEAIDYSAARRAAAEEEGRGVARSPRGGAVIRAFFAHHQGMSLVAFANVLCDDVMRRRFHADPRVRATALLLEEKLPRRVATVEPRPPVETALRPATPSVAARRFRSPHTAYPRAHFLSNGHYTTVVTNAGGGGSTCRGWLVTRWRDDPTCDPGSHFLYLRDVRSGTVWSATYQPTRREPESYLAEFLPEKAIFRRSDEEIDTQLEIAVSPEDDVEVRRLSLANRSDRGREIEITSYLELSLAPPADDLAHPAFGKLFLETTYLPGSAAVLCGRRPRGPDEPGRWVAHVLSLEGRLQGQVEWETDRARFLGRGRGCERPVALDGRPLSGTTGAVLDAIASLRLRLRLPPGSFARLGFATGAAADRAAATALAEKYHDPAATARAMSLAFTHSQIERRYLGVTSEEVQLYLRLASHVHFADLSLRAAPEVLARNTLGQAALWPHGISGDLPILLLEVLEEDDLPLVQQLLKAQEFWRLKALSADLVIVNEHPIGYRDEMHEQLEALLARGPWGAWHGRPGGTYLLRAEALGEGERTLLASVARAVLRGDRGGLAEQLETSVPETPRPPRFAPPQPAAAKRPAEELDPLLPRLLANPLGGFSTDGREYVIQLDGAQETPLPWANILANPGFGTLLTASGAAFTWAENSREHRLTPFANDPVVDPTGEGIFLRDEEGGEIWSATPGPLPRTPESGRWIVRHGAGISRFAHRRHGIAHQLEVFVDPDDPVKFSRLSVTNHSGRPRRLSVFAYHEWALGPPRSGRQLHVVTEPAPEFGAVLARNPFNT
ncbi:MAG: glucoamylase family protein, partial [Thermoanaerobaculia bacterium]